ncbi:cold-shock protein [Rhodophyticola sp. SM2404]
MSEDSIRVEEAVRGKVKWFDASKGFGFIVSDDGGPDILLHANVLRNFGQGSVADNALVSVTVQHTERGVQAQEVLSIAPPSPEEALSGVTVDIPETDAPFEAARIKWFDKTEDIFLHAEVLRSFGFADLMPGEAVSIRVADGPRGKMAAEIRSWDHVREE